MSHPNEHAGDIRAEWHDLLLRFAGWLADDEVTRARDLLVAGDTDGVARVVATATRTGLVPFTARDAERLRRLLVVQGQDASSVEAGVRDDPGTPPFTFAPVPPWGIGPVRFDEFDDAAIAAAKPSGATRLLRVWRYPPHGLRAPCRVYLVEVEADIDPAVVMGHLQTALERDGDPEPQVEVFTAHTELPEYQRSACERAELIWSPALDLEIRVAGLFDGADPAGGPFFDSDHLRIEDAAERAALLGYLRGGEPVISGDEMMDDVIDSSRAGTVPSGFRTDGAWVWPDAVAYYLDRYDLAPDADLRRHIADKGGRPPKPSFDAIMRINAFLNEPADGEAIFANP